MESGCPNRRSTVTERSEHPETVPDSESSAEDTNLDECKSARRNISASDDDPLQGNQSAAVPQPSTDDSSCTEPSDDTDSSSESVQEQVRACNDHM